MTNPLNPFIGQSPTQQTQQGHLAGAMAERTNTHEYVPGFDTMATHQFLKPKGYTTAYFKLSLQLEDQIASGQYIAFSFMASHRPVDDSGPPVNFYSETYLFDKGSTVGDWFVVNLTFQNAFLLDEETVECYAIRHPAGGLGTPSTLQLHRCLVTARWADLKTFTKDTGYSTLYGGIYGETDD